MTDIAGQSFREAIDAAPYAEDGDRSPTPGNADQPIGVVLDVVGAGATIALDTERLGQCASDEDLAIALAGQVGS